MARRPGPSLGRQDVLDAGVRVVEEQGVDALGATAVATLLGIRPPSVYHHFDGNDALRYAVAVEGWRRLFDALPVVTADPPAALRALAHAYRAFARAHPDLYRLMASTSFDPTDIRLLEVTARVTGALASLGIEPVDALHAVRGLRSAVHGFVDLELSGQFRLDVPSADQSFEWLLEVVGRGVLSHRWRTEI